MSIRQIRIALVSAFGARNYRITKSGEIHVYGEMPNTQLVGWYLFGWVGDTETEARIHDLD